MDTRTVTPFTLSRGRKGLSKGAGAEAGSPTRGSSFLVLGSFYGLLLFIFFKYCLAVIVCMLSKILKFVTDCAHSSQVSCIINPNVDGLRSRLVELGCRAERRPGVLGRKYLEQCCYRRRLL